jgi:site-specific DNA-methyltransferase (adenine-specific)
MKQFNRDGTKTSSFGTNGRINHDSTKFYNSKLYKDLNGSKEIITTTNDFPKDLLNTIIHGSCENMDKIPDNSLHLMITSPPYNVSKEYDADLSLNEYLSLGEKSFFRKISRLFNV